MANYDIILCDTNAWTTDKTPFYDPNETAGLGASLPRPRKGFANNGVLEIGGYFMGIPVRPELTYNDVPDALLKNYQEAGTAQGFAVSFRVEDLAMEDLGVMWIPSNGTGNAINASAEGVLLELNINGNNNLEAVAHKVLPTKDATNGYVKTGSTNIVTDEDGLGIAAGQHVLIQVPTADATTILIAVADDTAGEIGDVTQALQKDYSGTPLANIWSGKWFAAITGNSSDGTPATSATARVDVDSWAQPDPSSYEVQIDGSSDWNNAATYELRIVEGDNDNTFSISNDSGDVLSTAAEKINHFVEKLTNDATFAGLYTVTNESDTHLRIEKKVLETGSFNVEYDPNSNNSWSGIFFATAPVETTHDYDLTQTDVSLQIYNPDTSSVSTVTISRSDNSALSGAAAVNEVVSLLRTASSMFDDGSGSAPYTVENAGDTHVKFTRKQTGAWDFVVDGSLQLNTSWKTHINTDEANDGLSTTTGQDSTSELTASKAKISAIKAYNDKQYADQVA